MEYNCEVCNYKTTLKQCFNRHIQSKKHKIKIELPIENDAHKCINCNKIILSRTTLWRHSKTCTIQSNISQSTEISEPINILIKEFTEQNKQLTEQNKQILEKTSYLENLIIELSKNLPIHNTIDNSTTDNSTNNTFNLQFFLNEQCKHAIEIKEFIKDMIINISTLQNIENKGYITGVTECIVDNLNKYTMYTRPIHCITTNAEKTIHIRDENEWKAETENEWRKKADNTYLPETENDDDTNTSLIEDTISYIDEKIFNNFTQYQIDSDNEHARMKGELLKGIHIRNRNVITENVLSTVNVIS